jgi:hypothetical protein
MFRGHLNNDITLLPEEPFLRDHGRNRSRDSLQNYRRALDMTRMEDVSRLTVNKYLSITQSLTFFCTGELDAMATYPRFFHWGPRTL